MYEMSPLQDKIFQPERISISAVIAQDNAPGHSSNVWHVCPFV
jgi:hypothetical protein